MMVGAMALWASFTADAVIIPKLNVDAVKQRSQSEAQIDGVWVERDNNEPRHSRFLRFEPATISQGSVSNITMMRGGNTTILS